MFILWQMSDAGGGMPGKLFGVELTKRQAARLERITGELASLGHCLPGSVVVQRSLQEGHLFVPSGSSAAGNAASPAVSPPPLRLQKLGSCWVRIVTPESLCRQALVLAGNREGPRP